MSIGNNIPKMQSEENPDFSATSELYANENCLKNYNADVIKKITKGIHSNHSLPNILEFGAGIGALAKEYSIQNNVKPDCIEIDPQQIKIIQQRGFTCFNNLNALTKKYDAIYTSNVLEHIKDDTHTLKELHSHLKPGGRIAIYVPAFMCLWSEMDAAVGHHRRYSRQELHQKVKASGFNVLSCYYVDSIGFFAWLYLRFKGYNPANTAATNKSLKFFDRILYPFSKLIDKLGFRYLFGKNLMLIAEKPFS
jgi:SAM-dependent methyltransferase